VRPSIFTLFVCLVLCGSHAAGAAAPSVEPFPVLPSKKGLQVEITDDAVTLGVKHAALNFNLSQLIDPDGGPGSVKWDVDGKSYHFKESYVEHLDRQIKPLSSAGMAVYVIVLAYQSGNAGIDRLTIHPRCATNAPNRLGAFNTATAEGRSNFYAAMQFCAERWSRADRKYGRVVGYIIGNEVNSHWWWSNMGRVSMTEFADAYLPAVSLAQQAVRTQSVSARVYISLEHHWNIRYPAGNEGQSFAGRPFLDYFAKRAREQGDFEWHVAFHPYPENLFEPRFWNDKSATTNVMTTPRVTFKNIELLPEYLSRSELLWKGGRRSVILSEQGFHTPKGTNGETIQAAAYCYAWKKIEHLDGIDAFILHRHVDHPHEGGLLLGLRSFTPSATEKRPRKRIYECFRAADTAEWKPAFEFALPVVGLEAWPQ
jgi:hypothetical protein